MKAEMDKIFGATIKKHHDQSESWMSISDLMSGLMMVFLLIALALMQRVTVEKDKIKEVAVAYQKSQIDLYEALQTEFKDDLSKWDASIDKTTLAFDFNAPEVLFSTGSSELKPEFKNILNDFFPRYLKTIEPYKKDIAEVRIEGHTSSEWSDNNDMETAYFNNMQLSQSRTLSVLLYLQKNAIQPSQRTWVRQHFSGVGMASSHPKINKQGLEDRLASRRVSFLVKTNAELQIRKILEN